jgi:hypothetical protein
MTERNDLLTSIADTIKDYRAGEIETPSVDHVDTWVRQFDNGVQVALLREVDHVFKETYLQKEWVGGFLSHLVTNEKIAGADPCGFWRKANFLQIQINGHSQEEMLVLFDETLKEHCGFGIDACGDAKGDFIYLDDAMFSGIRVGNDLETWIAQHAPANAIIHVIVAAIHTSGEWLVGQKLKKVIADSGKKIDIKYWRAETIENRKAYKNNSEVLWPSAVPEDDLVKAYLNERHKFPFEPRQPGGKFRFFSSEAGRQLLEREFLVAGVQIRARCKNPSDVIRPLGFSPFGLGFGSMIATFRNCPNNCPLVLWWGDPKATSGPLQWYPLLPRKTYAQALDFDVFELI